MATITIKGQKQVEEFVNKKGYETKVVSLIRERYSQDDELAIQRQRDSKPQ